MNADAVRDWSVALMLAALCGAVTIVVLWLLADLALDAVKARREARPAPAPADTEGGSPDA